MQKLSKPSNCPDQAIKCGPFHISEGEEQVRTKEFFRFAELAPKEKDAVIEELSQRLIDSILITAEVKIKESMVIIDKENLWKSSEDITINVPVKFCYGDVLQIVSRVRRKG